uniref:hypothetical protein n=1 Tax=Dialister sp. TaxID=1955814 RepID=UPI00402764BF
MSENNEHELQQWAEQFYAKMVEEKQVEEAPSMMDQLLEKAGNWVDQEIENLPAEEQEAAVMKLAETADTLVDAIDKAYTVTEKACDSIIDSLDELEKWIDKW